MSTLIDCLTGYWQRIGNEMRKPKRYSIFEKRGDVWVRMTSKSYFRQTAIMVWQDELLAPYLNPSNVQGIRKLQPVTF